MASSLASQLAAVRSLNAARLTGRSALSSASYLFPAKAAAAQDLESVHALAANGWADLCTQEPTLARWSTADEILGDVSRTLDRLTLNKEANKRIDDVVRQWLQRCGPFLLSKPAAKCLEWLVRRFRIHEFSPLDVLAAFMPYHNTPQFARMLSLCKIDNRPHLSFLLPFQKRVEPIPASVIVAACLGPTNGPSLDTLRFVASLVTVSDTRPHRALIAFWTGILAQLCLRWSGDSGEELVMGLTTGHKRGQQRNEEHAQLLLSLLLPVAVDAAADPRRMGAQGQLGGLMLLCTIAAAFPFNLEAARSVVSTLLSQANVASLSKTGAQALLAAFYALAASAHASSSAALSLDTSKEQLLLSPASLDSLASIPDFGANVLAALDRYDISPFLSQLIGASIRASPAHDSLLSSVLDHPKLPQELLVGASRLLSVAYLGGETKNDAQRGAWLASLAGLRQRHPAVFDVAIREVGDEERQGRLTMAVLQAHLSPSANGSSKDMLWLRINDSSVTQRRAALTQLLDDVRSGKVSAKDALVQDMLAARLADEEQVLQVLYDSSNEKTLQAALGDERLGDALTDLLAESNGTAQGLHLDYIVRVLLPRSATAGRTLFQGVIWPRLLIAKGSKEGSAALHAVLVSSQEPSSDSSYSKLLHAIGKQVVGAGADAARTNRLTAATIATHILEAPSANAFSTWLSWLTSQAKTAEGDAKAAPDASRLLSLLVFHSLLAAADGPRLGQVAYRAANVVSHNEPVLKLAHDFPAELGGEAGARTTARYTAALLVQNAARLPLEGASSTQAQIDSLYALGSDTTASRTARSVYALAIRASPSVQTKVLGALFARLGPSTLALLASIWCEARLDTSGDAALSLRALASLKHAQAFLRSASTAGTLDLQTIVPALLLAMSHPVRAVRSAALAALAQVQAAAGSASSADIYGYESLYGPKHSECLRYADLADVRTLASALGSEKERIEGDGAQLAAVLSEALSVSRSDGKRQAATKRSLTTYLVSHVVCWNALPARVELLEALSQVSDAVKLLGLRPLLEELVASPPSKAAESELLDRLAGLVFAAYDRSARALVEEPDSVYWALLSSALASPWALLQRHAATAVATSVFTHSKAPRAIEMLQQLALIATAPEAAATPELGRCLATLKVDAATLLASLSHFRLALADGIAAEEQGSGGVKKARMSGGVADSAADEAVLRAFNAICMLLESALEWSPEPVPALVAEVFEILRVAIEAHGSHHFNAEQLVQPSISLLAALLTRVGSASPADQQAVAQVVRADIAVNVIKTSTNPQTFSQVLLLLSAIAGIAPDAVLHNAMSIFTFVGSTMLQRDDALSFNVVERTLRSVVPPLVASIRQRLGPAATHDALLRESRPFICVFTDAATHVPRHRRDVFFRLLVDVLGVDDFLSAVVMLLTDRIPRKVFRHAVDDMAANLSLPLGLLAHWPVETQIAALAHVWDEVTRLEELKDADLAQLQSSVFLDPMPHLEREHGARGIDPVGSAVALAHLVRHAVAALATSSHATSDNVATEGLAKLIRAALRVSESADATLSSVSRSALSSTIVVVPVGTLAELVAPLLSDASRRSGALDMFATKLERASDDDRQAAAGATPQVIEAALVVLGEENLDDAVARRRAYTALTVVARTALPEEHAVLAKAVPALIKLAKEPSQWGDVYAVLVPLATSLGPRLIAHLQALVALASTTLREMAREPTLALATQGPSHLILALLGSLPVFMASHLPSIISLACNADVRATLDATKFGPVLTGVAKRMPSAQVLEALSTAWTGGDQTSPSLHLGVLDLLHRLIRVSDRASVGSIYKAIFRFLLRVLDVRRERPEALSKDDLAATESAAIACFVRMVLKLNESTFRPLFLRLYDWAALDLVEEGMPTLDSALCARRIVLYKTVNALLDALQGLVAGYYATALDLSLEILTACNEVDEDDDEGAAAELGALVSSSMNKSARHDEGNLWNPTRLDKTLPVLLTTLSRHGRSRSTAQVELMCDTLCRVARAVGDESSLKLINSRLLSRARAASGSERLAVVQAASRFWSQSSLQNALLALVPETVPFISELLDSDEEEVLEATNRLVSAIEEVLGESLDAYLQ